MVVIRRLCRAAFVALCLASASAWLGPGPRAIAEQPGENSEYRALIDQALSEYGEKNYGEASALFSRAHAIYPNARTLRGLGMAAFEQKRYDECVTKLEAALGSSERPLSGDLRRETEALLVRAKTFVATVRVELTPSDAELSLDGDRVDVRRPLIIALGEHVLAAEAEGHEPLRRDLRVRGGESLELELALRPVQGDSSERKESRGRPLYKSPWLWTAIGVVVVGGAAAGTLLALRKTAEERVVPQPSKLAIDEYLSRFGAWR